MEISPIALILTAFFTLLIAVVSLIAVLTTKKNAKKIRRVSSFESILLNMGSSSRETIAEYRRELKKKFIVKENGEFQRILKKSELEKKEIEKIKEIVLGLSANFNRACAITVTALDIDLTLSVIDLFGDAFMDYWAICFEILCEEQDRRKDRNNRMFFEYMAYLSYRIFSREERTPETLELYQPGSTWLIRKDGTDMAKRIEELESRPALRNFAKMMNKRKARR